VIVDRIADRQVAVALAEDVVVLVRQLPVGDAIAAVTARRLATENQRVWPRFLAA